MGSYVYISQTTGKDAGKNSGDLLQVTSSSEFVGLRRSRHFLLFWSPRAAVCSVFSCDTIN